LTNLKKSPRILLISGRPGSGKTTLVAEAAAAVGGRAGGFYTREVRAAGQRVGFEVVTLDGRQGRLAHVEVKGPYRVGKYGVDLEAFEAIGVDALERAVREKELIVIDELGKMELFSARFRRAVEAAIKSGKPVLATVMLTPHPWVDGLKAHPDARLILLTPENRAQTRAEIGAWLRAWGLLAEPDSSPRPPG